MNWVKKKKLSAIKAIQYNSCLCIKLEELWDVLHNLFNSAQNQHIDPDLLNEISNKEVTRWPLFSKAEIIDAINKCNCYNSESMDRLLGLGLDNVVIIISLWLERDMSM